MTSKKIGGNGTRKLVFLDPAEASPETLDAGRLSAGQPKGAGDFGKRAREIRIARKRQAGSGSKIQGSPAEVAKAAFSIFGGRIRLQNVSVDAFPPLG